MARTPNAKAASQAEPSPVNLAHNPAPAESCGILTIDLGAIQANYKLLAARVTPAECAAVVKGDGYGCSIEPVTDALARAGCNMFFVAHLSEARRVRAVAPEATIFVLNGFVTASGPAVMELDVRPVINSLVELAEWDRFVADSKWTGGIALHVDTGMNRLGVSIEEAAAVTARLRNPTHGIVLVMSHLACADRPEHPLNDQQVRHFREIRALFRGIPSSLANSSGIFGDPSAHCDLVRPGVALFGANPTPGKPNPMRPVVELKARILQVRNVPRGATVGYGAKWSARRDSRIAIIAAGYADGIIRAAAVAEGRSPREVIVAEKRCRIVGRVSMDLLAVDVTDLPVSAVQRNLMATLIGPRLTLDEVAEQAGTIAYEVLTNLGRRFHRVWKS